MVIFNVGDDLSADVFGMLYAHIEHGHAEGILSYSELEKIAESMYNAQAVTS